MSESIRVSAEETREKAASEKALLVCAHDDELKFKQIHLEGAISYHEFNYRLMVHSGIRSVLGQSLKP